MQLTSAVAATRAPAFAASRCPTARTIQFKASPLRQPHSSTIRLRQVSSLHVRAPRHSLQAAAADVDVDSVIELEVKVTGMQCEGCVDRVVEALQVQALTPATYVLKCPMAVWYIAEREHLQAMPEVVGAKVDLSTGVATVDVSATDQFDAAMRALPAVVQAVQDLGFGAEPYFDDE